MKIFALVGKPNVGKSTLFNRLARKRIAIVNEKPGVTRDRNTAIIDFKGFQFILIDTGGFEPDTKEILPRKMREQSQLAVEEADGIIFLLDKYSGWTPQDQGIYDFLRNLSISPSTKSTAPNTSRRPPSFTSLAPRKSSPSPRNTDWESRPSWRR